MQNKEQVSSFRPGQGSLVSRGEKSSLEMAIRIGRMPEDTTSETIRLLAQKVSLPVPEAARAIVKNKMKEGSPLSRDILLVTENHIVGLGKVAQFLEVKTDGEQDVISMHPADARVIRKGIMSKKRYEMPDSLAIREQNNAAQIMTEELLPGSAGETTEKVSPLHVIVDLLNPKSDTIPESFHPDDEVIRAAQEGRTISTPNLTDEKREEIYARGTNFQDKPMPTTLWQRTQKEHPSLLQELQNDPIYGLWD